jgi:hypothetical protein
MTRCGFCGTFTLVGISDQGYRFCNQQCHQNAQALSLSDRLPAADIDRKMQLVHQGNCPCCQGSGPVDVHYSYWVVSTVMLIQWATHRHLCCQTCGRNRKLRDLLTSAVAGWWSVPKGVVLTPIQIVRNLHSLLYPPPPNRPSPNLRQTVQIMMGMRLIDDHQPVELANLPFGHDRQNPEGRAQKTSQDLYRAGVVIRWLLVAISALLLVYSAEFTAVTLDPVILATLAIVVLLPVIDRWIINNFPQRLSWFKRPWTRVVLWLFIFIITIVEMPAFLDAKLCLQTEQNACPVNISEVPQDTSNLYVSVKPDNKLPEPLKLKSTIARLEKVGIKQEIRPTETLFTSTAEPKLQNGELLVELQPPQLPIGDYQVSVRLETAPTVSTKLKFQVVKNSAKSAVSQLDQPRSP